MKFDIDGFGFGVGRLKIDNFIKCVSSCTLIPLYINIYEANSVSIKYGYIITHQLQ